MYPKLLDIVLYSDVESLNVGATLLHMTIRYNLRFSVLFIQFSINQLVCESFHHGTGILIIITEYCYTVLVNDETGVQLLTVMRTVYTRQITRVMMLVATRVSYFKFELIHVHAGWLDVQRYAT